MRPSGPRIGFCALAVALLAGCVTTTPGTGWNRAPDLSVYGAMRAYARNALEQDILCMGRSPDRASADWDREFSSRQAWVDRAMTQKYGADYMSRVQTPFTLRVACTDVPDPRWYVQYARLLRLLENRFGLMPERGG